MICKYLLNNYKVCHFDEQSLNDRKRSIKNAFYRCTFFTPKYIIHYNKNALFTITNIHRKTQGKKQQIKSIISFHHTAAVRFHRACKQRTELQAIELGGFSFRDGLYEIPFPAFLLFVDSEHRIEKVAFYLSAPIEKAFRILPFCFQQRPWCDICPVTSLPLAHPQCDWAILGCQH